MREAEEDELDRWPVGLPGLERGVTRFCGRAGRSPAPNEVSRQGWPGLKRDAAVRRPLLTGRRRRGAGPVQTGACCLPGCSRAAQLAGPLTLIFLLIFLVKDCLRSAASSTTPMSRAGTRDSVELMAAAVWFD